MWQSSRLPPALKGWKSDVKMTGSTTMPDQADHWQCGWRNPIIRYYYPDTLNRDYVAEQAEKEAEAKQARKEWVWAMGKEMAHSWWISIGEVKPMRIDLNLNPVVGGKVRVMCKSYRQATKKKAKLERAYPDSCYLIGQDTMGYFILRTK